MSLFAIDVLTQALYQHNACRHLPHSTSTNSQLMAEILSAQLPANQVHVLTAASQSAGRGQGNRTWQSPAGNVYLSLYYPVCHASHPLIQPLSGMLSLMVGYHLLQLPIIRHINDYRAEHGLAKVGVKWANDLGVYADNHADNHVDNHINNHADTEHDPTQPSTPKLLHKLAGILIEPVLQEQTLVGIIIGVGLNVQHAPKLSHSQQEGMSYQATSLTQLAGTPVETTPQTIPKTTPKTTTETTPKTTPKTITETVKLPLSIPKASDLYLPICRRLFAAVLDFNQYNTLNRRGDTPNSLTKPQPNSTGNAINEQGKEYFPQRFDTVDLLKGRRIQVSHTHQKSKRTPAPDQHGQHMFGTAVGIDRHGCLQLLGDDGKVTSLFTGKIDVLT